MKAFFAAVIGKSGYEKWKVNEPGVFYFLFYVQSREIPKKTVAGVARKESSIVCLRFGIMINTRDLAYMIFTWLKANVSESLSLKAVETLWYNSSVVNDLSINLQV